MVALGNGWRKVPIREWVLKLVGEAGSCATHFGRWNESAGPWGPVREG